MRLAGWLAFIGCWSSSVVLAQPNAEPDRSLPATSTSTSSPAATPTRSPPPSDHYLHDGFYLRYALGPAFWRLAGTATFSGGGFGEVLAIGGTIPKGFVIAAAASAVISSGATIGNYGVLVDWFPDARGAWHVGGLLGLGLVRAPAPPTTISVGGIATTTGGENLLGVALGATLFGGYDLWITPQCSLGLEALASTGTPASMRDPSGNASGYEFTPLWLGLFASVLYH
jgi:hypothetical protein